MKLSIKQWSQINKFVRMYCSNAIIKWGYMKIENNKSDKHNDMVYEICKFMSKHNYPFATEVKFESGYKPDVLSPLWIKPIIEVRNTEDDKKTIEKFQRIPKELQDKIIYVNAIKKFCEEDIL